jgi:hypothetical protein
VVRIILGLNDIASPAPIYLMLKARTGSGVWHACKITSSKSIGGGNDGD